MTSLRTVQVVNVRWFNATAWYGLELSRLLNAAGHETRVLGLAGTESFEKAVDMGLRPEPISAAAGNPLTWPVLAARLLALCKAFRPHIVNAHRGEAFALLGGLKKAGGYALVRTRGDQRLPKNTRANRYLHDSVADAVIATNSRMARHFVEVMGVAPAHVHTILGGVNTRRFAFDPAGRAAVRARYGFAETDRVVGLLGRFDRVKGQKESLEALARLKAQGLANARLLLLGFPTDTSLAEVEGWISQLDLAREVVITGQVDDLTAHLSALDVGLVASLWSEAIARAALEIMACGVPLVSTDVGVMPDLLAPQALSAVGDAAAFTALLGRAVTNVAFCESLRAEQALTMHDLSSERFLQKTLAVYQRVLG